MKITELYYVSHSSPLILNFTVLVDHGTGKDTAYSVKLFLDKRDKFTDWEIFFKDSSRLAADETEDAIMDFIELNWERIKFISTTSGNKLSDSPKNLKTVVVRWTAVYETKLVVDADLSDDAIERGPAADIDINVPDSEYQSDTWEVESITEI